VLAAKTRIAMKRGECIGAEGMPTRTKHQSAQTKAIAASRRHPVGLGI
jgi:hypothetical protein